MSSEPTRPPRRTLFDALPRTKNIFCDRADLGNEASVETFFVARILKDFGFKDSQIRTKESLDSLVVPVGGRKTQKYKPDYALIVKSAPRCIVDAKATGERLEDWIPQCSGYCLGLNQKFSKGNPVRYFVLSNGLRTLLYEWDSADPVLDMDFADFEWGNQKYERLKVLLSPKNIVSSDAQGASEQRGRFALMKPTSERARQLFAQCHKAIWKAEVRNPSGAFMAFVKVMFVKLWADKKLRQEAATAECFKGNNENAFLPPFAVIFSERWINEREQEGVINPIDSIFERLREDIEREIEARKKKRIFYQGRENRLATGYRERCRSPLAALRYVRDRRRPKWSPVRDIPKRHDAGPRARPIFHATVGRQDDDASCRTPRRARTSRSRDRRLLRLGWVPYRSTHGHAEFRARKQQPFRRRKNKTNRQDFQFVPFRNRCRDGTAA